MFEENMPSTRALPCPQLVAALDLPDKDRALSLARSLRGIVPWCKVGMELFTLAGPALLEALRSSIPHFAELFHLTTAQRKSMEHLLTPETLVIGFARRFAPYKRATLIFADLERLLRIMGKADRPVILVFSGKAHPADEAGINLIQEVLHVCRDERFLGRVFFMENYTRNFST